MRSLPSAETTEMTTPCQCTGPGWCERHGVKKSAHQVHLCQTRPDYFEGWEQGRGPGQNGATSECPESKARREIPPSHGAGTELKRLLSWLGIRATGNCACKEHAGKMDRRGLQWCETNIQQILDWMEAEAQKRKTRRIIASPGGAAVIEGPALWNREIARRLVRLAIRRARHWEERHPMSLTQLLCFEVGTECNLGHLHKRCPNQHLERYAHLDTSRELDDDTIVRIATRMYREFGFGGYICFHYYNEPLLQAKRMFRLIDRIREAVPWARFLLWTNGLLLPQHGREFAVFDRAVVTDYGLNCVPGLGCNLKQQLKRAIRSLRRHVRPVTVLKGKLDARLNALGDSPSDAPCSRMFIELVFGKFGNARICCHDWRGLASPGNVYTDGLKRIVRRFAAIRKAISGRAMTADAPEVCHRCRMRSAAVHVFDRRIGDRIDAHRLARRRAGGLRVGVVFCHYKMPEWRLREHLGWNDEFYRRPGVRVYVITDRPYVLPDYATCLVWPEEDLPIVDGRRMFAITRAKNLGDARAIADGADIIIDSDSDIAYTPEAWERMTTIGPSEAVFPVYHKIRYHAERATAQALIDTGCTGVVAKWAEVAKTVPWEAQQIGYGSDDRTQLDRIEQCLGHAADRSVRVWHIDHVPQDQPDDGRPSRPWNCDTLNPPMHHQNRRFVKRRRPKTHIWQPE